MVKEIQNANEYWAIAVPEGEAGVNVVEVLNNPPFWFAYARSQNAYPHWAVNGVRLIDVRQHWQGGDLLRARILVWRPEHVLQILIGTAQEIFEQPVEHTSFLQLHSKKKNIMASDEVQMIDAGFVEVCKTLRQQCCSMSLEEN